MFDDDLAAEAPSCTGDAGVRGSQLPRNHRQKRLHGQGKHVGNDDSQNPQTDLLASKSNVQSC